MQNKNIPYNKERPLKSHKIFGGGGPRDMQRRQLSGSLGYTGINTQPVVDNGTLKELLLNSQESREELKAEIRREMENVKEVVASTHNIEGIGLPFDVVEQKIREAVEQTEKQLIHHYESNMNSLSSQLNTAKIRIKELEFMLSEERNEFGNLKKTLIEKDLLINDLHNQQNHEVVDLKLKILDLIEKIKTGTITEDNVTDNTRPILEDKIFIDPLSKVTTSLESHIDIGVSEAKGYKVDLKSDVAKLKDLLGKGNYKPVKTGE